MRKRQGAAPVRLVAYVDPGLKRLAERAAAERHVSVSTLVIWALEAHLKPKGKRS
jgi:hypothetical protein